MKMHKKMTNVEIAELLRAAASAYEIKDKNKNKFKIIAYERAADAVEHLSSEAKDLWDEDKLEDVSGIGKSIAEHLGEIFQKGKSKHFEKLMKNIPPAVFELIKVSGIGSKTAYVLSQKLKISDKNPIEDLLKKAKKGKIAELENFGKDSEKSIIKGIAEIKGRERRLLLNYAANISEDILAWLKNDKNIKKADVLGSLRRKASTIGDIDLSCATKSPKKSIKHFTNYPKANRTLEKGEKSASIILPGNIQVDLKVTDPASYGSLLQHFTGSKHHNIALREYANKKNMSLSEWGIKDLSKGKKDSKIKKFADEKTFYAHLGIEWIPPELREDRGEIQTALKNKLPQLVELKDVKADLQIHSDFDVETSHDLGDSSMREIVKKANILGYEYIAFTEHNPSQSGHNPKETLSILKRKKEEVENINSSLKNKKEKSVKKVFNSLEIDILPDGSLPVDKKGLETLDFALVSIHSSFRQSKKKMTKRVLSALSQPKVKIFAHPTGRKLNEREGVELDWEKIFDYCGDKNIWIEINADPMRLDLPDILVKDAVDAGIKFSLGTDAHHKDHMENMKYAVYVARRGWATKKDIINTRTLTEFQKLFDN